jgi:hypothetical protein
MAVIPHALRILERDCVAGEVSVRDSAVKGLMELEGIIHPRLPVRKGPVKQMASEEEEETEGGEEEEVEEDAVLDGDKPEDMDFEEPATEADPIPAESLKTATEKEVQKDSHPAKPASKLPSFVAPSDTHSPIVKSSTITSTVKITQTSPMETHTSSNTTTTRSEGRVNDIFNTGAWKQPKTEDAEEEEEEIPEIDMGFDSDEE